MINQQTSGRDAWAFFDCKNSLFYVELRGDLKEEYKWSY